MKYAKSRTGGPNSARDGCNVIYITCVTRAGVAIQATVENIRDFVWEIYHWDPRTPDNVKPYFFLNEMNKKVLPAIYSAAVWCLFVVLLFLLALLRNHCYSFHRTKWRLVTSIFLVLDQSQKKCRFFRRNSNPLQIFQLQPKTETSSSSLGDRLEKKSIISPIKSSHLCRTSRQVWLSCSACDHCRAYQLICFRTIGTLHDGCKHSSQCKSLVDVSFAPWHPSCKCQLS